MTCVRGQQWPPIPRPLHRFLPSKVQEDQALDFRLPQLKHLHLCLPSGVDDAIAEDRLHYRPKRTERAVHQTLRDILVASRMALKTLVLEQRIGVIRGLPISRPELLKQPDPSGIGSKKLCK